MLSTQQHLNTVVYSYRSRVYMFKTMRHDMIIKKKTSELRYEWNNKSIKTALIRSMIKLITFLIVSLLFFLVGVSLYELRF